MELCPLLDGSCSRGTCYAGDEPVLDNEEWYGCGDDCCGGEEVEQPTCSTCTSNRFAFADSMGLDAPRFGRGGGRGGGRGRERNNSQERRSTSPAFVQGGVQPVVKYPAYPKPAVVVDPRRPTSPAFVQGVQPVVRYPSYPAPIIRDGPRRSRYRNPIAFLPNVVDAISGLLGAPRRRRYRSWYPRRYYPLYIDGNRPNPDLGGWGMDDFPPDYGQNALPFFKNLPLNFHFGDYMGPGQVLTSRQEDELNQALAIVNDQLVALRSATRFSEWTRRGFKIIPDLRAHRFIWVYSGELPRTTITEYLGNVKLSCSACGGHGGELKELAKLTHESIVFDVRGKEGDAIFKGFYISKSGHVFGYHIAHDHENPELSRKETISELIPGKLVPAEEMERLIGLMAKLQESTITHQRRHTGPIWIDGFHNFKRVHIYGDDDSFSPIAEEIKNSVMAIIRL